MTSFSIVTINWNNLAGLAKTYESVAAQTYRNFRWIVIDGASNDGSVEWLKELKDDHAEITSERDKGIYDAMNKGLVKASETPGYTLFLNSGDTFYDESVLEKVAQAVSAAEHPPKYVYGDYYLQNATGVLRAASAKKIDRLMMGMPSSHQAMYFENEHLRTVRFRENYKLSADYCMIVEFLHGLDLSKAVLQLKTPLCVFDTTGISQQRRFDALKEDMQIRRNYMKLSSAKVSALYLLHYVHTHTKLVRAALGR
ncbi:glycosyltransferase family 2 protein [Pseudomonas sp.]|jgi:putative colanic acid biosynthesis glycosyltransferase|uniref:glycosyltransferase family 2 protein n=1 Tax=Pseudomonas sp. TaxID=306 RepID=UPI0028AE14FE|nr:glycosyltransferase family 2 protein [Pseudomonas sp.]